MWSYILEVTNSYVTFLAKYQPGKYYFLRMLILKEIYSLLWTQEFHYRPSNNWKAFDRKLQGIRSLEYVNAVQTGQVGSYSGKRLKSQDGRNLSFP